MELDGQEFEQGNYSVLLNLTITKTAKSGRDVNIRIAKTTTAYSRPNILYRSRNKIKSIATTVPISFSCSFELVCMPASHVP